MITQLDAQAAVEGTRSELIRRTLSGQLHPTVPENYPKTCARPSCNEWQLTRSEVDHVVSVVIKGMAASSYQMTEEPTGTTTHFLEDGRFRSLLRLVWVGNFCSPDHSQSTTAKDRLPECQQERTTRFLIVRTAARKTVAF